MKATLAKLAVITLLVCLAAGTGLAVGESLHTEQALKNSVDGDDNFADITVQNATDDGIVSKLSFVLSWLSGAETPAPGDTTELSWEITTADFVSDRGGQTTLGFEYYVESGEARTIVEIYDCYDAGCDDPDRDEFVEAVSKPIDQKVWSRHTYEGSARYQVPSDSDGPYAAVAYIWVPAFASDGLDNDGDDIVDEGDGSERKISDAPEHQFTVQEQSSGSSDGSEEGTDSLLPGDSEEDDSSGSGGGTDGDDSDGSDSSSEDGGQTMVPVLAVLAALGLYGVKKVVLE
jgi:hypothetical protein